MNISVNLEIFYSFFSHCVKILKLHDNMSDVPKNIGYTCLLLKRSLENLGTGLFIIIMNKSIMGRINQSFFSSFSDDPIYTLNPG